MDDSVNVEMHTHSTETHLDCPTPSLPVSRLLYATWYFYDVVDLVMLDCEAQQCKFVVQCISVVRFVRLISDIT